MLLRFKGDHLADAVRAGTKRATLRTGRRPHLGERLTLLCGRHRLVDPDPAAVEPLAVSVRLSPLSVTSRGVAVDPGPLFASLGHASVEDAVNYYRALNGDVFDGWVIRW